MNFFYIDDSFFRDVPFLQEMRKRLFHLCRKRNVSMLLISTSNAEKINRKELLKICKELRIEVLYAPSTFEYHGVKGVLSQSSLLLEHFPSMQVYSGSVVCYHIDQLSYERIYLDLFPNLEVDFFQEDISEEIEHIIGEFIQNYRKKNRYH